MKIESSNSANTTIKILNDEQTVPKPTQKSNAPVPLAPVKKVSLAIGNKTKVTQPQNNNTDHYVIKGANEDDGETIDLILAELGNTKADNELVQPSGEITEVVRLSGGETEEEEQEGKPEEIVEHVCGKCYKTFRRFNGLKKHLDFCRFDSGYHLRKAEMLKNLEKIEKDSLMMEKKDTCFCCLESYDTCHLGHINCPDCPKSFKSQMSYERHIFITHAENDDFACTTCNAKLRSANLLKLHLDQHVNRGKPFACKVCGKDFTRSYHLKRHQKYSSCSGNEIEAMHCKVCNKAFFRLDNLRAHLKQHLGTYVTKKPEYMCPICKNCFYSLSTLNIHTRTHTGERPFECDLCDKKFPSLVSLKKHRRYHTGEKPYKCSVCNQAFAVKEVLNRHMKRHTGERPHTCQECGKGFIQATQLRNHSRTHLRPFECSICQEKFKTERQLERHTKSHRDRRRTKACEFSCTVCKKGFKKADELAQHIKKGDHDVAPATKQKVRERTDCPICEKNFDSAKSLGQHMLDVHEVDPAEINGEKPLSKPATSGADQADAKPFSGQSEVLFDDIEFITTDDGDLELTTKNANPDGTIVQELMVDEVHVESEKGAMLLSNSTTYTVIPLDTDEAVQTITVNSNPTASSTSENVKKENRKSLAESLAAAIADDAQDDADADADDIEMSDPEDIQLKDNVTKLLDMLVDAATLKQFGWPRTPVEQVLCKVIENCGHDLSKDADNYDACDYATRMREYVKLLFTVVIHNDSIKALLNNYPIDEVIEYVLGNDDADDEDVDEETADHADGIDNETKVEAASIKRDESSIKTDTNMETTVYS